MPSDPITVVGKVLEERGTGVWNASLPNGKVILAHLSKKARDTSNVAIGSEVVLEMTPYDFEKGRIREVVEK